MFGIYPIYSLFCSKIHQVALLLHDFLFFVKYVRTIHNIYSLFCSKIHQVALLLHDFLFFVKYVRTIHNIKGLDERNSKVQNAIAIHTSIQELCPPKDTILLKLFWSSLGVNVIVKLEPTILLIFSSNMVELHQIKALDEWNTQVQTELSHVLLCRSCNLSKNQEKIISVQKRNRETEMRLWGRNLTQVAKDQ